MTQRPVADREDERRYGDRREDGPPHGIDRRGAAPRSELRFLVTAEVARSVEDTAREHLKLGDAEADAPWYTTTYCDSSDHDLYHAAAAGTGALLRFREYHARRPELALASYRVWIEWKEEDHERSAKERLIARPREIGPFLRGEPTVDGGLELSARRRDLIARGLRPVVVTQCRRVVYASRRDQVRVTFDHELTYFAPERTTAPDPAPCPLGPIIARERGILVEVKWQDSPPAWVETLLETLRERATDRPGKFVVAMRHLMGESRPA